MDKQYGGVEDTQINNKDEQKTDRYKKYGGVEDGWINKMAEQKTDR